MIASGLFGFSLGNMITLPALIIHREFEPEAFATVVALSVAIGPFIDALGPGVLGWVRDISGGYDLPLLLSVALDIAAAAAVLVRQGHDEHRPGRRV